MNKKSERVTKRVEIDNPTTRKWLLAYKDARKTYESHGFKRWAGTPQNVLYEIDDINNAASRIADDFRRQVGVDVEYAIRSDGNAVWCELWARRNG